MLLERTMHSRRTSDVPCMVHSPTAGVADDQAAQHPPGGMIHIAYRASERDTDTETAGRPGKHWRVGAFPVFKPSSISLAACETQAQLHFVTGLRCKATAQSPSPGGIPVRRLQKR